MKPTPGRRKLVEHGLEFYLQAIDVEPELPGSIPNFLYQTIKDAALADDKDAIVEILRATVRATKKSIRERVGGRGK